MEILLKFVRVTLGIMHVYQSMETVMWAKSYIYRKNASLKLPNLH